MFGAQKQLQKCSQRSEKTKETNKFRLSDQDLSKYIAEGVLLWHLKDDHKLAAFKILKKDLKYVGMYLLSSK